MRRRTLTLLMSGALAGCSGKSEVSEQIEERADNRAEAMEAAADSMTNALQQNIVREQAKTVREAGEERAEAIRQSQLDAETLNEAEKARLVTGDQGTPAPATR